MKTIKNSKDITTLEVGDVVMFGNLEYGVVHSSTSLEDWYYLNNLRGVNDAIFERLNINKKDFVEKLGIDANCSCDFPETKSLEALTAIVSALFKEYEKQNDLPKTWEEFCKRCPIKEKEVFINSTSDIVSLNDYFPNRTFRLHGKDRNMCTSKQEAEAFLALMQLRQLRKCYIKDCEPNWMNKSDPKYGISVNNDKLSICTWYTKPRNLSFPTYKLAIEFLTNFKDLLEIAKPLL